MYDSVATNPQPESEFKRLVEDLTADLGSHSELTQLLREDNAWYSQRGSTTIVRMRGWVLLAISRMGASDDCLLFILEELDTSIDAYLVAAAARALRTYPVQRPDFAPFVLRALTNTRYRNDLVSFESYGGYATDVTDTTPITELIFCLLWLGPVAREILPDLRALRSAADGFSTEDLINLDRAIETIAGKHVARESSCCDLPARFSNFFSWASSDRRGTHSIESVLFEDQNGDSISFKEFFVGSPSIVAFFYTRCDNPMKCSLTITKLGRVQKLLEEKGVLESLRTAAITYDPGYDIPRRLHAYGKNRDLVMDNTNRVLRAVSGDSTLGKHFELGVNFVNSLVNRHRIEIYLLDKNGQVAASFQRLHWDEAEVVARVMELLAAQDEVVDVPSSRAASTGRRTISSSSILGMLASLGVVFFPKCPLCWAGYLSLFGVAGLQEILYYPWIRSLLIGALLINIIAIWFRSRLNGRMAGLYLAAAGVLVVLACITLNGLESLATIGTALTIVGTLLSSLRRRQVLDPVLES